jgi:hypothetical protein
MAKIFRSLDWLFALGLIGYPLWQWYNIYWKHQAWGHFNLKWTTWDFIYLLMAIVGALYIFLKKVSD